LLVRAGPSARRCFQKITFAGFHERRFPFAVNQYEARPSGRNRQTCQPARKTRASAKISPSQQRLGCRKTSYICPALEKGGLKAALSQFEEGPVFHRVSAELHQPSCLFFGVRAFSQHFRNWRVPTKNSSPRKLASCRFVPRSGPMRAKGNSTFEPRPFAFFQRPATASATSSTVSFLDLGARIACSRLPAHPRKQQPQVKSVDFKFAVPTVDPGVSEVVFFWPDRNAGAMALRCGSASGLLDPLRKWPCGKPTATPRIFADPRRRSCRQAKRRRNPNPDTPVTTVRAGYEESSQSMFP